MFGSKSIDPHGARVTTEKDSPTSLTAFPESEAALREHCAEAVVDRAAFERRISRCDLTHCRGTCCYDGIHVDDETAAVLTTLARDRAADFRDIGIDLPEAVIVQDTWRGSPPSPKTATRPFPFKSLVNDYPAHFNDTACVFLLDDARCALQVLAQRDGKHPWFYKPFGCWLHPISVSEADITLPDEQTDPYRFADYDGFASRTHCGRTCKDGAPAADVLRSELEFLEKLLRRDLLAVADDQAGTDSKLA
jgi:hypothetical protein